MFIDIFYLALIIILIIGFTALFILTYNNKNHIEMWLTIFVAALLICMMPIQYKTEMLVEYEFSEFRNACRVDYVSPFTGESIINQNITSLPLCHDMKKHYHLKMEKYYSIIGISFGEKFVINNR